MIEATDHRKSIFAIFEIGGNLIFNEGTQLTTNGKTLPIELPNSYRFGHGLISTISSGRLEIHDPNFSLLRTLKDKRINPENTGVETFSSDDFGLFRFIDTNELEAYRGGKKVSETKDFWGKLLSSSVRLNFNPGTFDNPTYFRCSDLSDEKTFFEFTCKPGQEIIQHFVLHDRSLLFPIVTNNKIQFIKLDVASGKILSESAAESATFNTDNEQLKLISFWATTNSNQKGRYQIVDVRSAGIEVGDTSELPIVKNIYTPQHLQYLYGNHMYFADNRRSYDDKIDPVRFGRMDLRTKKIDFVQEISLSPTTQISEIVEHEGHVYVRNLDNELFTYKLINS
jgi:hypothetical protein